MSTEKPLDLKPCPFCGGPAVIDSVGGPNTPFQAECTKCLATGHRAPYEKKAAEFWNRRAPVESVPAPVGLDMEATEAHLKVCTCGYCAARLRASLSPRPATGADQGGANHGNV